MAVAFSARLEASNATATSTITTSSISPGANRLLLFDIAVSDTSTVAAPTSVVGNSLTWTLYAQNLYSANQRGQWIYWALGASPSAGTVVATLPSAPADLYWAIYEFTGTDLTTPLVQQVATNNSGASISATLAALAGPGSMGFVATLHDNNQSGAAASGWLLDRDWIVTNGTANEAHASNRTDPGMSWASSALNGLLAVEIQEPLAVLPPRDDTLIGHGGSFGPY
jgi:hypothetical protein